MGTMIYGEEGEEGSIKRCAGKDDLEFRINFNRRITKKEYIDLIKSMIEGLNL